ncbi:WD40 repeat-like protein [Coprinellus micaceus]|uniref:WD40 repeat-like protein n=1 Tax=Coprinellus micaceus TaxID=71717 RepID=A0A4Y7T8L7_COPMI|nr:WD40 repeat-like protein [Coprinellus micaceus]
MIQTGLISNAHGDLVTDAVYDFYGLRLATCSLDQRIKVWRLEESGGTWSVEDDWKAHDAPVSKLSWAHPEFGSIIASGSFDRTVKIWEQTVPTPGDQQASHLNNATTTAYGGSPSSSRWVERASLYDARGTIRAVEFAPHHFGLKLATIATDNILRIYECLEQPTLSSWQLIDEIDIANIAPGPSPTHVTRAQTAALATPTQTHATLDGASATLVAQALRETQQASSVPPSRAGLGNREADGGWDTFVIIAAGAGNNGVVKIIQLNSRRSHVLFTLEGSASTGFAASSNPSQAGGNDLTQQGAPASLASYSVTSVAWAPSCGRSYHLIATAGRDGHVRIWKLKPPPEDMGDDDAMHEDGKWTATSVGDFDHHKSAVGRVEWNITGTVLSSAGNDGRIRLWKATANNVWRLAGSIGVEQTAEEPAGQPESKDVDMEN